MTHRISAPQLPVSSMHILPLLLLALVSQCLCSVTIYHQKPFGTGLINTLTATASAVPTSISPAFNDTILVAPPVPNPPPPTSFTVQLQSSTQGLTGVSTPLRTFGSFFGFSIEMSVVTQVLGKNSSFIQVPFLNLLSNIVDRSGKISIRLGGNTQEFAVLVDALPDENGRSIAKQKADSQNPTQTPAVQYTIDFFYMMSNISSLLGSKVGWYLGVPLNDTQNLRLQIAELGDTILGDSLLGLQVGNEPDLYLGHQLRTNPTYGPQDYSNEFGTVVNAIGNDNIINTKNKLLGPSVATGAWTPEMVWDTGFVQTYSNSLSQLTVEHYPDNNCFNQFGTGEPRDPQTVFQNYLNHSSCQSIVAPYLNSGMIAQQADKPFTMFETNSASCGGFPGVSDSFGATLWALDYGLQMAYANFTGGAMLHVGGAGNFYNPFTAPPTNQSSFNQWTVGAVYYSALVIAEIFGKPSNGGPDPSTWQTLDVLGNDGNMFTPQYAIYENGQLSKVALFNYVTDTTGASWVRVGLNVNGGVPAQVKVKYLLSQSVSFKDDITWAGQSFGTKFTVDGRLRGDLNVTTVPCDQASNTCTITVPSPGFALVFIQDQEGDDPGDVGDGPQTFATTARTTQRNTATIDPAVLATSNGHSGKDREELASTSPDSSAGYPNFEPLSWTMCLFGLGLIYIMYR